MKAQKIVVLGTGGTIAGRAASARDNVGYTAAQLGVEQLLAGLDGLRDTPLVSEQVAQLDSKDMSLDVWRTLARHCAHWLAQDDVRGLVITHGTDTLEETAWWLHSVLAPSKPVVLTCAMRPATSAASDGPQNLIDAVTVACADGAQGVVAVCAGSIHGARELAKVHTYRTDAFSSGEAGPVGVVEEGAVRLLRPWPVGDAQAASAAWRAMERASRWPRVEILTSHAGAGGAIVQALCAQGVDGLVVAGTGNGTVHQDLQGALLEARVAGVAVVRATRCAGGQVLGHAGDLLPHSNGLSPVKARIAMILSLLEASP